MPAEIYQRFNIRTFATTSMAACLVHKSNVQVKLKFLSPVFYRYEHPVSRMIKGYPGLISTTFFLKKLIDYHLKTLACHLQSSSTAYGQFYKISQSDGHHYLCSDQGLHNRLHLLRKNCILLRNKIPYSERTWIRQS
jgi:hypothetical protein